MQGKLKLCIMVTVSLNLQSLYREQFSYLISEGFEVTAIASPGLEHQYVRNQGARSIPISMERTPSLLKDLVSLVRLWWFFVFNRFDVISVSTPKASLLGVLAARLSLHHNVVYMVRGRAYENMKGLRRFFYQTLDWIVCHLSKKVHSISKELSCQYVKSGICSNSKMIVLGHGSSNGVDLNRFSVEKFDSQRIDELRASIGIPEKSFVYLYCGRIRKDKGIQELVAAFDLMQSDESVGDVALLIIGGYEEFDPLPDLTLSRLKSGAGIYVLDWCVDVERFFALADVFVFPSYREGFGNVAIEASAMKLPVLAFDVVGCRESIEHGVSGLLSEPFTVEAFYQNMRLLYNDRQLCRSLGDSGYTRARALFSSEIVWAKLAVFYKGIVE